MRKNILLSLIVGVAIVNLPFTKAFGFACPITDSKNMSKVFQNVTNVFTNGTTATNTAIKDQELNNIKNGNPTCSSNPANQKTEIKTTSWEYISKGKITTTVVQEIEGIETKKSSDENIIDLISRSDYLKIPQELKKISEAKKILIDELFFKDKNALENASASDKEEIRTKRKRYASEVASKGYALAYALRPKLKEDAESLVNTQTSGCNQTQSHALQNRNLKALIKTTAANIAIQIMSMETEAALQLLNEPLVEMTAEDVGGKK